MSKTNVENFLRKYAESDFDEEQVIKNFDDLTKEDQNQVSEILFGMFKDTPKNK